MKWSSEFDPELYPLSKGLISNYQQLIDGYLSGHSREELAAAAKYASGPIDIPAVNLGFGGE